jgi:hypothetical protein
MNGATKGLPSSEMVTMGSTAVSHQVQAEPCRCGGQSTCEETSPLLRLGWVVAQGCHAPVFDARDHFLKAPSTGV